MDKTTLLSYQPNYYKDSKVMENVNNANAIELNLINDKLIETTNQVFIETATFCLERWEKDFGIRVNKNSTLTLTERRNRIIAKLRGQGTSTVKVIQNIAEIFIPDGHVDVIEHNSEYYFEIDLKSKSGFTYELKALDSAIDEIKPAHLGISYKLTSMLNSHLYINSTCLTGQKITIYPWQTKKLQSKTQINISQGINRGSNLITIYPKEGGI